MRYVFFTYSTYEYKLSTVFEAKIMTRAYHVTKK